MEPTYAPDGRIELKMSVDHGIMWPLSDMLWREQPDWDTLITPELKQRLREWCRFFAEHASIEEWSLGGEENRRWFDREAVALLNELDRQIGDRYKVTLDLWY
ncbi:MAG: hypothetical protein Q4E05_03905 [Pseudoclavibacter sp.]|nr:hypothetical protein [Pseudoclavibacter sp.]